MYLEELIENVELESDKFECKSRLNREDVVGWLKSIAGFANASGGDFYIGVGGKNDGENLEHFLGNRTDWRLSGDMQRKRE